MPCRLLFRLPGDSEFRQRTVLGYDSVSALMAVSVGVCLEVVLSMPCSHIECGAVAAVGEQIGSIWLPPG